VNVTPLVTQLTWTLDIIVLAHSKWPGKWAFCLRMVIQFRWGKREFDRLSRQILFESNVLHPSIVAPVVRQVQGAAVGSALKVNLLKGDAK